MKICGCKQAKSIPGLISSIGLCQKHYNMLMFGTAEERKIAAGYRFAVEMSAKEWQQHKQLNNIK